PLLGKNGKEEIKRDLNKILSQSIYQKRIETHPEKEKVERKEADYDWLRSFINWLGSLGGPWGGAIKFLLYFCILVLIIAILSWILLQLFNLSKDIHLEKSQNSSSSEKNPEEQAPQDLAQKGDFVGACRAILLNLIVQFMVKNLIPIHLSHTNGEISRQLRSSPIYSDFREIARIVEKGYYGKIPLTQKDFEICWSHFCNIQNYFKEDK
ncbi:MAG: hypothetical protein D6785_05605, partial [Planctomycetota bacterium]